jgi:hypothetical protein
MAASSAGRYTDRRSNRNDFDAAERSAALRSGWACDCRARFSATTPFARDYLRPFRGSPSVESHPELGGRGRARLLRFGNAGTHSHAPSSGILGTFPPVIPFWFRVYRVL